MSRAADIPAITDLLCERCGYTLAGVDPAGNCPECGTPISESHPELRQPPTWEDSQGFASIGAFLTTSAWILFLPGRFFRKLSLSAPRGASRSFGLFYRALAAILLSLSAWLHFRWFGQWPVRSAPAQGPGVQWLSLFLALAVTWGCVEGLTHVVSRLTAWEAAYRGLRLPRQAIDRALDYHAVHLIPPVAVGLLLVGTYAAVEYRDGNLAAEWVLPYIYALCGAVVLSAIYIFATYWAAMRKLLYANRSVVSSQ